jgi:hypothetical protein
MEKARALLPHTPTQQPQTHRRQLLSCSTHQHAASAMLLHASLVQLLQLLVLLKHPAVQILQVW